MIIMQRQVDALDKQLEALSLRKSGVPYVDIAKVCGYKDGTGAWRAVKAALKKTLQEPSDELRAMELARLDDMLSAIADKVAAGDLKAIDRALKIQERRAKLLGLDMPVHVDVTSRHEQIIVSLKGEEDAAPSQD